MLNPGFIKVTASIGKGLVVFAKGHPARLIAVAAAVGIVTISIAIAAGTYLAMRYLRINTRRTQAIGSKNYLQLLR